MQKLLAMLASEQPGEADAARRKLMEHLAHHRLSLTDLSQRLGQKHADRGEKPSFVQGAREMSLERQLGIAREARQEAERESAHLRLRVDELHASLQRATVDIGLSLESRDRVRQRASIAWGIAALCLLVAAAPYLLPRLHGHGATGSTSVTTTGQTTDSVVVLHVAPGERVGTVLVQDLAVRLTPYENAGVRAFLNQGARVVIEQQVRVGMESWLLIRSVTGSGWVRASDILH